MKESCIRQHSLMGVTYFGFAIWYGVRIVIAGTSEVDQALGLICAFACLFLLWWAYVIASTISDKPSHYIFCSLIFQPFPNNDSVSVRA